MLNYRVFCGPFAGAYRSPLRQAPSLQVANSPAKVVAADFSPKELLFSPDFFSCIVGSVDASTPLIPGGLPTYGTSR